ncbi:MAG: hypothetical protein K2L95_01125 [Alphaproteobacteria bacterium]|nr:hypothetical protein [Alphaproteobacteria bacterium]MDE6570807.1 hypothetical protein [Alphaproteobacteria bacterium]
MARNQTTSFSIARYILFFILGILGIGIGVWILTADRRIAYDTPAPTTTQMMGNIDTAIAERIARDPCARDVADAVARMWAYTPDNVPAPYKELAQNYANETLPVAIHGNCNDVQFECQSGDIRRNCDPCAVSTGRMFAQSRQIADWISEQCGE